MESCELFSLGILVVLTCFVGDLSSKAKMASDVQSRNKLTSGLIQSSTCIKQEVSLVTHGCHALHCSMPAFMFFVTGAYDVFCYFDFTIYLQLNFCFSTTTLKCENSIEIYRSDYNGSWEYEKSSIRR